jgi:putative transcriptional regulator
MADKITLHNRIKVYRVAANMSREELAVQVGVNFQTIGYLEREEYNPSLELALKIAAVFDAKIEELFSFVPFSSKPPLL